MPPPIIGKLTPTPTSDSHDNVIRNTPWNNDDFCSERDVATYAAEREFPIIPCDLCGSQSNLKRVRMKTLISELEKEIPHIR